MTPLGFSGGSHDRVSVSAVERIRWTVGTADGAADWRTEMVSGIGALTRPARLLCRPTYTEKSSFSCGNENKVTLTDLFPYCQILHLVKLLSLLCITVEVLLHCRLLFAVSEQTQWVCDRQSDLESALRLCLTLEGKLPNHPQLIMLIALLIC